MVACRGNAAPIRIASSVSSAATAHATASCRLSIFAPDAFQPFELVRRVEPTPGLAGEVRVPARVTTADGIGVVGIDEAFLGVLADRLQHVVAGLGTGAVDDDERLVDQARQHVEHIVRGSVLARDDELRGFEGAAAGEDREAREDEPLHRGEEVVRPVDRGAQRVVTLHATPAAGEEPEALVNAARQLFDAEHAGAGSGELDRQGHAVQPAAEARDDRRPPVVQSERRVERNRPLDEEADRRVLVERRHGEEVLPGNAQALPARRQHRDAGRFPQHRLGDPADLTDDVLAVVEHHQELAPSEQVEQRFLDAPSPLQLHAEDRGDHVDDARCLDRSQLDQPRPVRVPVQRLGGHLDREARLADAANSGQRHDAVVGQQAVHRLHLALASDEGRQLDRQVRRQHVEREQRRERSIQPVGRQLEDALRLRQVTQPGLAQVDQRAVLAHHVADERGRRLRDEDLPAVPDAHQARAARFSAEP